MDFQFLKFSGLAKIAMHIILKGSDKKVIIKMKISTPLTGSLFLKFIKHASDINNGDCLVCNKDIYHKQADYIEKYFS